MSDRGSESTSRRTQEFLLEKGISHDMIAPFTKEQNCFIERENRSDGGHTINVVQQKSAGEIVGRPQRQPS